MNLLVHVTDVFEIRSLHSRLELRRLLVYNGSFLRSSSSPFFNFLTSLRVCIESNRKAHYSSVFS